MNTATAKANLEKRVREARNAADEAERELAQLLSREAAIKEAADIEVYLFHAYMGDKPYADSIAFHYDVRAAIAQRLGYDHWDAAIRESNQSKTIAALARMVSELTGEKWDRR